jgi:hypothetical protein
VFKTSLGYIVRPCLKERREKEKKKKGREGVSSTRREELKEEMKEREKEKE